MEFYRADRVEIRSNESTIGLKDGHRATVVVPSKTNATGTDG